MEKEEIARDEQFLLFPQCFLLNQKIVSPFVKIFDTVSLFAAEVEETKIGMWDKGLNKRQALDADWSFAMQEIQRYRNISAQTAQADLSRYFPTHFHRAQFICFMYQCDD